MHKFKPVDLIHYSFKSSQKFRILDYLVQHDKDEPKDEDDPKN